VGRGGSEAVGVVRRNHGRVGFVGPTVRVCFRTVQYSIGPGAQDELITEFDWKNAVNELGVLHATSRSDTQPHLSSVPARIGLRAVPGSPGPVFWSDMT
jgi:hypothetical protein